jgi:hypothetical protein
MNVKLPYALIEVVLFHLHMRTPNQIIAHVPPTCIALSFIVTTFVIVLLIILWCRSWAQLHLINPRRMKLDHLC